MTLQKHSDMAPSTVFGICIQISGKNMIGQPNTRVMEHSNSSLTDRGDPVACRRVVAARRQLVHIVLKDGSPHAGNRSQSKTERDAGNAAKFDVVFAQQRVDDVTQNRDEDDDRQRVLSNPVSISSIQSTSRAQDKIYKVAEKVIRRPVGYHGSALVRCNRSDSSIIQVPDGEVQKAFTLQERVSVHFPGIREK